MATGLLLVSRLARAVAQAEALPLLLADQHAGGVFNRGQAVTGLEFRGILVGLDGQAQGLGAAKHGILDIIRPQLVGLGTVGVLTDGDQAVPGHAIVIGTVRLLGIQRR